MTTEKLSPACWPALAMLMTSPSAACAALPAMAMIADNRNMNGLWDRGFTALF